MSMVVIDNEVSEVARVVEEALSQNPIRLPSWLFYDEAGDKLFQSIMGMPEYYLTRCEYEILDTNKDRLQKLFADRSKSFNLIELGAGDGFKTEILLKHFYKNNTGFIYTPVDVSETVLKMLKARLEKNITNLSIKPINNRYEDALSQLEPNSLKKVFLFLGANIGNFTREGSIDFLSKISAIMSDDDQLLIGFDLKKDPRIILAAYDDAHGITRDFNLNLLRRLNRELGANFNTDFFSHYPYYDPETGVTKSYLVSQREQEVYVEYCDKVVHFSKWEIIHTEISQKYDTEMIQALALKAGLHIEKVFYDSKKYFCDVLMRRERTTSRQPDYENEPA